MIGPACVYPGVRSPDTRTHTRRTDYSTRTTITVGDVSRRRILARPESARSNVERIPPRGVFIRGNVLAISKASRRSPGAVVMALDDCVPSDSPNERRSSPALSRNNSDRIAAPRIHHVTYSFTEYSVPVLSTGTEYRKLTSSSIAQTIGLALHHHSDW